MIYSETSIDNVNDWLKVEEQKTVEKSYDLCSLGGSQYCGSTKEHAL